MRFLIIIILLSVTASLHATTPTAQLVTQANLHLQNSEIDQALELYESALEIETDSPIVLFNKATALLHKNEFEDAARLFKKTERATKDISLKAKCNYHIGHCYFKLSPQEEELKDQIRMLKRSAKYFSQAVQNDNLFIDAGYNLEFTRRQIQLLLEEKKRREDLMQQIQDKMQELAEMLQEILKEQSNLLKETQQLSNQQQQQQQQKGQTPQQGDPNAQQTGPSPGKTPSLQELMNQLSKLQSELQKQSNAAAKMANQLGNNPGMGPPGQQGMRGVQSLISRAGNSQGQSMLSLQQGKSGSSQFPQRRAMQDIQEALDMLSQQGQGKGKGDKSGTQKKPGDEGDQKGDKGKKGDQKGKGKSKGANGETPWDIIEEEQENKKIRTGPGKDSDVIKVEKDW